MIYVTISHFKDVYLMLTPEKKAGLYSAGVSFMDKCLKSGKCLEIYYLSDMKGLVTIWDLASSEEGARLSLENPWYPFIDNEFIPVIESDVARKVMEEMLEAAQKTAKK